MCPTGRTFVVTWTHSLGATGFLGPCGPPVWEAKGVDSEGSHGSVSMCCRESSSGCRSYFPSFEPL
jgi:hypothetical protein